jgi:hypothetical protein
MSIQKNLFIAIFFSLLASNVWGQSSIRDSSISMSVIGVNYTFSIPSKDMGDRFGSFSQLGLSYSYKFKNNLIIGANAHFMFGTNVRDSGIFDNISTYEGYLIDNQGLLVPVAQELRGFNTNIELSYLIPVLGPNPNSGLVVGIGTGFLQHRIFHTYSYGPLIQIEGDYAKGYDRLTNGGSISQHLAYYRFNNKNLGSFHIKFSVIEAFTKNRRDLNYDSMEKDDRERLDILYQIGIGIDIPVYSRSPEKFYIH